jgi:molybdenum cofactor cytidylyltransferase
MEVIVVVRDDLPGLENALEGLPVRCVPNPRYQEGMGTSLSAGIGALSEAAKAALVTLGDMPSVSPQIVERLLESFLSERKAVTMPRYGEQVGPPTLFSREVFPRLTNLRGEAGGRRIVAESPELAAFVPFPESERPLDIDTPEDLEAWRTTYHRR